MRRTGNVLTRVDWLTIAGFLLLVFLGWLNIYAAVYDEEHASILDFSQRYGKQFMWILAAILIALFVLLIDNRFYYFFTWFIYGAVILMLMLVLVFGKEVNGARAWFEFGGVSLQPSEFAKFATALAVARYIAPQSVSLTRGRHLITAVSIFLAPVVLIIAQPDMGSSLVFLSLFFVLFREGMSPYIFITGLLMILLFLMTLILEDLYLLSALIIVAFVLSWITTRRFLLAFTGLMIIGFIIAALWALDNLLSGFISLNLIVIASLVLAGIAFSFYIYRYKLKWLSKQ